MIHIYPANRIENLVLLFDHIQRVDAGDPLHSEIVVVQNQGMRHWLSMRLAEQAGVCMNIEFLLPAEYFWRQIDELAHGVATAAPSTYSREVMAWRLDAVLAADETRNEPLCAEANAYWQRGPRADVAKRFQLARQIADLFEQYLIYRPDWIRAWDQSTDSSGDGDTTRDWQAWLWRRLVAADPEHPLRLLEQALARLPEAERLPPRVSFFGINAMPPLWLDFLGRLGEYTQVHLFHLNPCVEYWGDLRSEKQLARQFARWADDEQWASETGNPLLAALGAQGREFLSLLQEHASIEIPAFEPPAGFAPDDVPATLLQRLQNDILELRDGRETPTPSMDDSLTIVSSHNALREVQGLHDWLLRRFDEDPDLTPGDVCVMCPAIERYAPYIEAVFTRDRREVDSAAPRLPCSIADRVLKDAEPLVAAFATLLELPDSRFRVSEVLAWLRLPAIGQRFSLADADLERITSWLESAAIHWGLDAEHKREALRLQPVNDRFTWEQGLERLLLGFANGDQPALYRGRLLLPDVEGDDALLLGRLIQLLDTLRHHARELRRPRTASAWRRYLNGLRDELFSTLDEDRDGHAILTQVIDDFGESAQLAGYHDEIPLAVVRDLLEARFATPEPGRQFMSGQITFCSMIPMRSVPFRIIAVLGLNDGEYPRQRIAAGFDLMAGAPRRGDRSRRGDDRYLFLEVLISARERLYLSFQGNDIKTNQARQPSLILQELMDYLEAAHGWTPEAIRRLPLQPFSPILFDPAGDQPPSFDPGWARLATPAPAPRRRARLDDWTPGDESIPLQRLIEALDHAPRAFARERLGLRLEHRAASLPDDAEPFAADHLLRYRFQQQWVEIRLEHEDAGPHLHELRQRLLLDGHLPDVPGVESMLDEWITQADAFAERIRAQGAHRIVHEEAEIEIEGLRLSARLPIADDDTLLFQRLAETKGKDHLTLWLHHLFAQCARPAGAVTRGFYRGGGKKDAKSIELVPLEPAEACARLTDLVALWRRILAEPLLLDARIAAIWRRNELDAEHLAALWRGDRQRPGLGDDATIRWFWPEPPPLKALPLDLYERLYIPLDEAIGEPS